MVCLDSNAGHGSKSTQAPAKNPEKAPVPEELTTEPGNATAGRRAGLRDNPAAPGRYGKENPQKAASKAKNDRTLPKETRHSAAGKEPTEEQPAEVRNHRKPSKGTGHRAAGKLPGKGRPAMAKTNRKVPKQTGYGAAGEPFAKQRPTKAQPRRKTPKETGHRAAGRLPAKGQPAEQDEAEDKDIAKHDPTDVPDGHDRHEHNNGDEEASDAAGAGDEDPSDGLSDDSSELDDSHTRPPYRHMPGSHPFYPLPYQPNLRPFANVQSEADAARNGGRDDDIIGLRRPGSPGGVDAQRLPLRDCLRQYVDVDAPEGGGESVVAKVVHLGAIDPKFHSIWGIQFPRKINHRRHGASYEKHLERRTKACRGAKDYDASYWDEQWEGHALWELHFTRTDDGLPPPSRDGLGTGEDAVDQPIDEERPGPTPPENRKENRGGSGNGAAEPADTAAGGRTTYAPARAPAAAFASSTESQQESRKTRDPTPKAAGVGVGVAGAAETCKPGIGPPDKRAEYLAAPPYDNTLKDDRTSVPGRHIVNRVLVNCLTDVQYDAPLTSAARKLTTIERKIKGAAAGTSTHPTGEQGHKKPGAAGCAALAEVLPAKDTHQAPPASYLEDQLPSAGPSGMGKLTSREVLGNVQKVHAEPEPGSRKRFREGKAKAPPLPISDEDFIRFEEEQFFAEAPDLENRPWNSMQSAHMSPLPGISDTIEEDNTTPVKRRRVSKKQEKRVTAREVTPAPEEELVKKNKEARHMCESRKARGRCEPWL